MGPEDGFRNVPRRDQTSSSSDDDDEYSPLRKRIKTDNDSDDGSVQKNHETNSIQYTLETVLTGASWDAAEASLNLISNGDQQSVISVVTDANNNDSLATDQSAHESQIDIDNCVSDDTKTDLAVSLESTVQPDTRYVIPQNSFYRPFISDLTTKHNISSSANETDNKHEKPNTANGISANLEQIREDFIRSWDRILAADDLMPEAELAALNSTVAENICQYLDDLGATNSTNEALAELVPRVCDEIFTLQQRDERVDEFQSFEPEPEPIPYSNFLTEPVELPESSGHGASVEEYDFDITHWNRIQQAFIMPEQIPDFDELFTNSGITVPRKTENESPNENLEYHTLTNVPYELAHIYSTIIREAAANQHSNVFAANRVHSENPCSFSYINSDANSFPPNCDADLYRSLLGIPSPFARNENTSNQQTAMTELDNILKRSVEPERVPPQIFSKLSAVKPNSAEHDMYITKLESTPETNNTDLTTNAVQMETTQVELQSIPFDFEINPTELGTNPSAMVTNTIEFYSAPVDFQIIPVELGPNPSAMVTNTIEFYSAPVDFQIIPVELVTNAIEMETNRNDMETVPADIESIPIDIEAIPIDIDSIPIDIDSIPIDIESIPVDMDTNPVDMYSNEYTQTNFSDMETNPVDPYSTPVDFATNTVEMETSSVQMETTNSIELVTKYSEMEINPIVCDMTPAELNTTSVESASNPDVFGSNSNQEDSAASNPTASDPYEGCAHFVIVPGKNDFKPLKIYVVNPNDAGHAHTVNEAATEQSASDEIADSPQEVTNDEEEIDSVETENDIAIQEMNRFETEISTIETEITTIIEEADRFEQQAARFEESAGEFQEVEGFFRQISEIFEFAALSLQEAIDDFESIPIEEATNVVNELDPLSEGIAVEDDNVPDQEVPDIEHNDSCNSKSS